MCQHLHPSTTSSTNHSEDICAITFVNRMYKFQLLIEYWSNESNWSDIDYLDRLYS